LNAFLPADNLDALLSNIRRRMEVIAPILVEGTAVFATWKGQPLALQENPLISPLEFLLPQNETLFRYVQDCGRYTFEKNPAKRRMIFGIRPCDLRAVDLMDDIFRTEPADSPYFEKRSQSVLVALTCLQRGDGCMCGSFGQEQAVPGSFDLELTWLGDGYLIRIESAEGKQIAAENSDLLHPASESHVQKRQQMLLAFRESCQDQETLSLASMKKSIKDADWRALGERCLCCGSCTFVCPVCHCFTINDAGVPDGERMRCRDTCLLSGFSRMAGGANPRISQGERLQNWYRDKFEHIPERTGKPGCVGCGRCSRVCMADIDRWTLEVE